VNDSSPEHDEGIRPEEQRKPMPGAKPLLSRQGRAEEPRTRLQQRSGWHEVGVPALVAAVVAATVSVAMQYLPLGGGSDNFGGSGVAGTLVQKGSLTAGTNQAPQEVYYPVPYESPPNLRVDADGGLAGSINVLEQKPDHFKISNTDVFGRVATVRWTAEGMRR
jgi:hypothetical protein